MKIAIPHALLYYYYFPLWDTLFKELGFEVVDTGITNKDILDKGSKAAVSDICAPIKIFTGHVIEGLEKADYVFVPRFARIKKPEYFCPKFMGLPDIIEGTVEGSSKRVISPIIYEKDNENISSPRIYNVLTEVFGFSHRELRFALKKAEEVFLRFKNLLHSGLSCDKALESYRFGRWEEDLKRVKKDGEVTVAVLGYVYDVYDSFISMDVIKKLEAMNVNIKTFEMVPTDVAYANLKHYRKNLFWTFSNRILGAGLFYLKDPEVDGVIHVTAFGCGPDAIVGRFLQYESDIAGKPFTTLRVDEHTGEGHMLTRLEAFVDMLKRKKWASVLHEV
ncbi:acyl-CoA dehydratase activase-related protein [Caldicellulosiruptor morganii]|uniref:Acyl-CoA dehydratase activase-related protein n=1 Tax=Caldicellulosiruptor morganii TaxID=1387555 RepID=A0ABY7BQJ8_9FIRM|nr:acyl-CoA dehydratase activase-related protein [Caldicellulosiruptor morganii]WAM34331.1 acyl-CoA dehydratase activase-related protein [Caldicellulosiruptor morganii]